MDTEFIVLYTHQKQKKAKTWHDGVLRARSQAKKATLFDDKGSRLDSIYIMAGDITLGEQLESDRYYILVEEVKKATDMKGSSVQQNKSNQLPSLFAENTKSQGSDGQTTLLSSQGRCSGLKRKKSGFVPPRMIKAPRQTLDEASSQNTYYNNDIIGQSNLDPTLKNSSSSHTLQSLNSRNYDRQPVEPSTFQGKGDKNSEICGNFNTTNVLNHKSPNAVEQFGSLSVVKSASSPLTNYMRHLQKVCFDSQESNDSDNKLKSPWSVYGSNSGSPQTCTSPRLQEKRTLAEERTRSSPVVQLGNITKQVVMQQNKYEEEDIKKESFLTSEIDQTVSLLSDSCAQETMCVDSSYYDKNKDSSYQSVEGSLTTIPYSNNEQKENLLQSKRSMAEIMNLLKGKTSSENSASKDNICESSTRQSVPSVEPKVDNLYIAENGITTFDKLSEEKLCTDGKNMNSYANANDDVEKLDTALLRSGAVKDLQPCDIGLHELEANDSLKTENSSFEMNKEVEEGPSFAISFSPLSHLTDSDDEDDKIEHSKEIYKEPVMEHKACAELISCEAKENKTLSSLNKNDCSLKQEIGIHNERLEDKGIEKSVVTVNDKIIKESIKESEGENPKSFDSETSQNELYAKNTYTDSLFDVESTHDLLVSSSSWMLNRKDGNIETQKNQNSNSSSKSDVFSKSEYEVNNKSVENSKNDIRSICDKEERFNTSHEPKECENHNAEDIVKDESVNFNVEIINLQKDLLENSNATLKSAVTETNTVEQTENSKTPVPRSFTGSIEISENTASNEIENRPIEQSFEKRGDFIDLIDSTRDQSRTLAYTADETCDIDLTSLDEVCNDTIDRKVTQSQDTMDCSCDTMSHCSCSQQFSDSQIPVVPDIELKFNRNGQLLSPQIPVASESLDKKRLDVNVYVLKSKENIQQTMQTTERGNKFVGSTWSRELDKIRSQQDCESLLTQIDHFNDMNESRTTELQQDTRRQGIADKRVELDVVSQLPHPSQLFGKNLRKKCQKSEVTDLDIWGRENIPPCENTVSSLSEKINEKLKGYKISGSICSGGASRDFHQQKNQKSTSLLKRTNFSPCQRLSDYDGDISTEASPSLFEDCEEERIKIMNNSSLTHRLMESPDFTVPDVCSMEPIRSIVSQSCSGLPSGLELTRPAKRHSVFISDSDSSKDCSPGEFQANCIAGVAIDEEYIYTQIYKPRPMVQKQQQHNIEIADTVIHGDADRNSPCPVLDNSTAEGSIINDESSEEFFTQQKPVITKRESISGGLHLFREKQKKVLKSQPFDDTVIHTSYNNFSFSSMKAVNLQANSRISNEGYVGVSEKKAPCISELENCVLNTYNNEGGAFGELGNSCDETVDKGLAAVEFMDDHLQNQSHCTEIKYNNGNFSSKTEHCFSQTGKVFQEGKVADESDWSSQDLSEIMSISLRPKGEQCPVSVPVPEDMTGSSKWEKYNSQHSDEDLNLSLKTFQTKKDFSVIEKPLKDQMKFQNKKSCDRTLNFDQAAQQRNASSHNLVLNSRPHMSSSKDNASAGKAIDNTRTNVQISPDQFKIPSSFSSLDSFEQMLANDNINFNDPELDKVLLEQNKFEENVYKATQLDNDNGDETELPRSSPTELKQTNHPAKTVDLLNRSRNKVVTNSLSSDTCEKKEYLKGCLESDISFSLDDSFMTSNTYQSVVLKTNSSPAVALRVPWKHSIDKCNRNRHDDAVENKSQEGTVTTASHLLHKHKLNGSGGNFMGYDSEDDCSYIEDKNMSETAFEQKGTERRNNSKIKSNFMQNCNTYQYKTCSDEAKLPDMSANSYHTPVITPHELMSSLFPKESIVLPQKGSSNQSTKFNKRFKPPALVKSQMSVASKQNFVCPAPQLKLKNQPMGDVQAAIFSRSMCGELLFPMQSDVQSSGSLMRQVSIPTTFMSVAAYKNILVAAVTEYLNLQLFELAKKYKHSLSKVDISDLMGTDQVSGGATVGDSKNPSCHCGAPSKVVQVKKQGANNGRFFYACSGARKQQCKFFQWLDERNKGGFVGGRRKISEPHSLITHMKSQRVHFYSPCSLVSKCKENIKNHFKPKWARKEEGESIQKKQLYLKLSYKGHSSLYSKDDLWVISQHLDFDSASTFIVRSTYFGPTSSNEVEIDPIIGYSPSNWNKEVVCHALLVGNASSELSYLDNMKDHISQQSPPIIPSLLNRQDIGLMPVAGSGFQAPRMTTESNRNRNIYVHSEEIDDLVRAYIEEYHLNEDQAEAIKRVGSMFSLEKSDAVDSILLIHGVFGAGKSFLLSVVILFLVKAFQMNDLASPRDPFPWKLLVSSTTNVAVDRILQGLLDLGFEEFVRVGSVKKIAKPILPYSVHGTGTDNHELKDLQEMLRSGELTSAEKQNVRQGIEKLRKGENKKKLAGVRVVGVTCASCLASCINNMQFPLVLLDECSQMTEPSSLLPIARFGCQKLLLVGDPKQLDPTIQGSDSTSENGLEQTMFDRLIKMGYLPTLLRTQYRCHPNISAVSNKLFYGGMLIDGVSVDQRLPVLPDLPTICFYDVDRGHECCEMAGSYYNEQEAQFVVFLIQFLMSHDVEPQSVGVITLYRSQMARITDLLNIGIAGENKEIKGVQVSTVDAFQGGERDVIILSTVRTQACGFIDNDKRMNVALTRARNHLLIVGNHMNLSKNLLWAKVLDHCRGFPGGVQSADEARQQLESVLDRLKQDSSLHRKDNNLSEISGNGEKKSRKRKKIACNKKRKTDESVVSESPSVPESINLKSNSTESPPLSTVEKMQNVSDFQADSPPISLSHSSEDSEMSSMKKTSRNPQRPRHGNRLNPDLFDCDEDNSDGEFVPFIM